MKTKMLVLSAAIISSLLLYGCGGFKPVVLNPSDINDNKPVGQLSLEEQLAKQKNFYKFENYDELTEFLENHQGGSNYYKTYYRARDMETFAAPMMNSVGTEETINLGMADGAGSAGSGDYSQTNIQVAGVDEADIIKTDGKYVYAVSNNNLFIVDAYPAGNAKVLSKIEFKSAPTDIYLNHDKLIIYGPDRNFYQSDLAKIIPNRNSFTYLKVFDITDRKNPKQIRDLDFEGNYENSRQIGDYVYFITQTYTNYVLAPEPVPLLVDNGEILDTKKCEKCLAPEVYYFDMPYNNYSFLTVSAINTKNIADPVKREIYLVDNNQAMYVSENNMYLTHTKYLSEYQVIMSVFKDLLLPKLSIREQTRITEIENTPDYILNEQEKMNKIGQIIERYQMTLTVDEQDKLEKEGENKIKEKYQNIADELEKTVIHKIEINKGDISFTAMGEVKGSVLNQYSMDEKNGYFRIATTRGRVWSEYADEEQQKSYSNVYVLNEELKPVGAVENLAPGEKIYSSRFIGDRVYLVTFKQTDPLFAIDLKNPMKPQVLGELKVTGFSNYLHPYDENILIGVGKETKENEHGGVATLGVKISLFDVSDVASPREIDKYVLGEPGTDSIALYDPHAFLFSKEKNLLVIPVSIHDNNNDVLNKLTFSGAAVFSVDKNGLELVKKIDHYDGTEPENYYWYGYRYGDTAVKRSLYIDNILYTFSNKYLKMNKIGDFSEVKNLELKLNQGGNEDFNVVN